MGSSVWAYFVPYQPSFADAFDVLKLAVRSADGTAAPDDGTILDMDRVLAEGDPSPYGWLAHAGDEPSDMTALTRMFREHGEPEYGAVVPVTAAEALDEIGVAKPTRADVEALDELAVYRGFGRCAVLHDATGAPAEIYFWGRSGD